MWWIILSSFCQIVKFFLWDWLSERFYLDCTELYDDVIHNPYDQMRRELMIDSLSIENHLWSSSRIMLMEERWQTECSVSQWLKQSSGMRAHGDTQLQVPAVHIHLAIDKTEQH